MTAFETKFFDGFWSFKFVPFLQFSFDLLMVRQGEEIFKNFRVSYLRVFDQIIEEKFKHRLLIFDELFIST